MLQGSFCASDCSHIILVPKAISFILFSIINQNNLYETFEYTINLNSPSRDRRLYTWSITFLGFNV